MACYQPAPRKILELGEGRSGASLSILNLTQYDLQLARTTATQNGPTAISYSSYRYTTAPYLTQQITSASTLLLVDDRIQRLVEPLLQIVDSAKLPLVRICLMLWVRGAVRCVLLNPIG